MEIIIITSIVVAVFGAVALAWALSQGGTPGDTMPGQTPSADNAADAPSTTAGMVAESAPEAADSADAVTRPAVEAQPAAPVRPEPAPSRTTPPPMRLRMTAPERSGFDGIAAFAAAAEVDQVVPPIENIPTPTKSSQADGGMALNTRPGAELAVPGHPLRLNAIDLIASQIETLYEEYVRLDEERSRLAQELLTNMLFEKIERTAGRLEIVTEQTTLDLRRELIKVSAEYDRVQFRLGSLQHLNARLGDPRVAHQIEELVVTVRALAGER